MNDLKQLYSVLRTRPGLKNIDFTEQDVSNVMTPVMFTDADWYDTDLSHLEDSLYLSKVYGTSMDTPVKDIDPYLLSQITSDKNYHYYIDDAYTGLYSNGYIGDTRATKTPKRR